MLRRLMLAFYTLSLAVLSPYLNSDCCADDIRKLYLKRATGDLEIYGLSQDSAYQAYFHIPIAIENQVPIFIEVKSPDLIDYRFVHLAPPNLIIAARLKRNADITQLNWNGWVIIKEIQRNEVPYQSPIPSLAELPEETRKWLQPTACVQINEPMIIDLAQQVRGNHSDLMDLAGSIHEYCARNIPFAFLHDPFSLDAWYALKWGSSCTGHSHAASALFRANGIPSRNLMNILTWVDGPFDMHWFNDYYVPGHGWIQMDPTSTFMFKCMPQDAIIMNVCHPEDEFPLFFTRAIEGRWYSSDPALGTPDWGRAHYAYNNIAAVDSTEKIDYALSLASDVFARYTNSHGIELDARSQQAFETAVEHQTTAFYRMRGGNLNAFIAEMENALTHLKQISQEAFEDIFYDDFESDAYTWTHGGDADEWELGSPQFGPDAVHSGSRCWGTDLDDTYEDNASNWLQSPWIDLSNLNCAFLKFWVWNRVDDKDYYYHDALWLDISTNGTDFVPLCSRIIGGHDDPAVPDVSGWNYVTLDLTPYVGNEVTFRFRFDSDESIVQSGTYIDDVQIYGKKRTEVSVEGEHDSIPLRFALHQNYPNPFNSSTRIEYELFEPGIVKLAIINQLGKEVARIEEQRKDPGRYSMTWQPASDISSGVYFAVLSSGQRTIVKKCMYLK